MATHYDVIVIGAGPGGYVAAIRCAQLGLKTACIDDWTDEEGKPALGGTCLNVGCIPSKVLLESSERFEELTSGHAAAHGIHTDNARIDTAAMIARKTKIVAELTDGIEQLFKANKIDWHQGHGTLLADHQVALRLNNSDTQTLGADNIILAPGSLPTALPVAPFDGDRIVDSSAALDWTEVPPRLGIIGAGVIGLELGSLWRRLGSKVVILEALEHFLPAADTQIARLAKRQLNKQGLDIRLGAKLESTETNNNEVTLAYSDSRGGRQSLTVDRLIVAIGRQPNTAGCISPDAGISLDDRGRIEVDELCQTSQPGIWAIGDAVRGPMLAHKASEEGIAVAERIAGQKPDIDYDAIPFIIYTQPEIAWVGSTEQTLKSTGIDYRSGSFNFAANGRAKAMQAANGQVKILADAQTDRLLGVQIIGPMASELIGQAVIAIESENTAEDLARSIFAHPTLSEALHEAALAVDGRMIHGVNRRR